MSDGHAEILTKAALAKQPINNEIFFENLIRQRQTTLFDRLVFDKLQAYVSTWQNEGILIPPLHINKELEDLCTAEGISLLREQQDWADENGIEFIVEITERALRDMTPDQLMAVGETLETLGVSYYLDDLNCLDFASAQAAIHILASNSSFKGIKIDVFEDTLDGQQIMDIVNFAHALRLSIVFEKGTMTPEEMAADLGLSSERIVLQNWAIAPEIAASELSRMDGFAQTLAVAMV